MKIRRATKKDAKELYQILNHTKELAGGANEETYPMSIITGAIKNKKTDLVLIAEIEKEIAGFHISEVNKHKKLSFTNDIFVKSKFRKMGIAKSLQKEYEKFCKKLGIKNLQIQTQTTNKKMQKVLSKFKFKKGDTFIFYEKILK